MADIFSSDKRSQIMGQIRGKNTRPELLVRSLLHRAGFRFRLHDKSLPGKPDIFLRKYNTAIFVHGCYWHRHSACKKGSSTPSSNTKFWNEKFSGTIVRDIENKKQLEAENFKVIIVWECELKDIEKLSSRLQREITKTL